MKIIDKNRSWQIFSNTLNKLWPEGNSGGYAVHKDETCNRNQFKLWRSAKRKNGIKTAGLMASVNVEVLEKFVRATAPHISYQGFIASHLQNDHFDAESTRDTKKSLAIERMVALVEATIADIKKIEINQISYNKG